jgi:cytoskeletal protein CcmA (bactofilin family)
MPLPSAENHRPSTTVIGPDTHIKGEMVFDSTARILGTFEGRIIAKGEVQIGESANCKASVEGTTVIVDGAIEGDVLARERVQLNARARVTGDVVAATMVVAEGASFVGHCRVGAEAAKAAGIPKTPEGTGYGVTEARRVRPVVTAGNGASGGRSDMEATLAGLEARLSGLGRGKQPAETGHTNGAEND